MLRLWTLLLGVGLLSWTQGKARLERSMGMRDPGGDSNAWIFGFVSLWKLA